MYILGRSIAASRDRGAWLAAAKSSDRVEHYVESWILSRDVISGSAQRARQRCIARPRRADTGWLTLAGWLALTHRQPASQPASRR
jgi:hypothetical protein